MFKLFTVLALTAVLNAQQSQVGSITAWQGAGWAAQSAVGAQTIQITSDNAGQYTCGGGSSQATYNGIQMNSLIYIDSMWIPCSVFACNSTGTYVPLFVVGLSQQTSFSCFNSFTSMEIAGGATGYSSFLLGGLSEVTALLPMVVNTFAFGPFQHDMFSVVMYVPLDPVLQGCYIETQAIRPDPINNLIYASNRFTAKIL